MNTIHLQGIGTMNAKPAGELNVGDVLSWNYSHCGYQVTSIKPCGKKSIYITEKCIANGEEYTRRLLKSRLVAA